MVAANSRGSDRTPWAWGVVDPEVVIHLADSDAIAIDRMKRMLIEDEPPLLYADETAYVKLLHTHDQDLEDALTLIEVGVAASRPRSAAAVAGRGVRPGRDAQSPGRVTVGGFVVDYVQHVDTHLQFIYLAKSGAAQQAIWWQWLTLGWRESTIRDTGLAGMFRSSRVALALHESAM